MQSIEVGIILTIIHTYLHTLYNTCNVYRYKGNSWTNADKITELNRSLEEAVNRNREIYQLKVYSVRANEKMSSKSKNITNHFLFVSLGFR